MTVKPKLVVFDMDGTLIQGRLIEVISRKFKLTDRVTFDSIRPISIGVSENPNNSLSSLKVSKRRK